jgi:glutamate 5-kinase
MADSAQLRQRYVCGAQRVVVKVGTNVLAPGGGDLEDDRVAALVAGLAGLRGEGRQVALVTSGAIGCGMAELGMAERPRTLPLSQATASVGQGRLMALYERHLHHHDLHAAQILLTHADFDSRERYLNACNTIHTLFELPCLPVINENDTISTAEIQFGENDHLAALVTHLIRADLLVLLTSVPGLCTGKAAEPLDVVEKIDEEIEALVYDEKTALGIGGMRTKIEACRIATDAGEAAVIADGREPDVLARLFRGERVGTLFLPAQDRLRSRKRWIRFTSRPRGTVRVDAGARRALVDGGKSLLPSGITGVDGDFKRGDVVRIAGPDGVEFARGLSNYAADEVGRIQGCHTAEIKAILGYEYYGEIVHRDNMALLA